MPEDVLVEAGGERVGQLVTEEAEVVGVEGSPNARPHLPHHLAKHIYKLTLISHLNSHVRGSTLTTVPINDSSHHHCCQQHYIIVAQIFNPLKGTSFALQGIRKHHTALC